MQGLTDRQAQVLNYIEETIREHGYAPTLREIGAFMGIRSTNGVNDHLRALERKGFLSREDMKSRTLRPIKRAAPPLQESGPPSVPSGPIELGAVDARDVFALMTAIHGLAEPVRNAADVMRAS